MRVTVLGCVPKRNWSTLGGSGSARFCRVSLRSTAMNAAGSSASLSEKASALPSTLRESAPGVPQARREGGAAPPPPPRGRGGGGEKKTHNPPRGEGGRGGGQQP